MTHTPREKAVICLTPINAWGVLDHQAILTSDDGFHNPMRVIPNGEGSEVLLTICRGPETSETAWVQDYNRRQKRPVSSPADPGGS